VVKRLKGTERRRRREAEGYDDVNTFGVLAAEGFLPGYGLEVGSVLGTAEIPFWRTGAMEFTLPRPPSVALREYVPGNLIYANGNRFVARRFHRDVDEHRVEMPIFEVSTERQAVKETSATRPPGSAGSAILPAIAVCDVDLTHQSHISDDEELRFQMGVAVYGYERDQHNGGRAYRWGEQPVHHRRGVGLRLVNVGSSAAIQRGPEFGYPVCTVCGQSISPLSSDRQWEHFEEDHLKRCGRKPTPVGFYADVVADTLSLPACVDSKTAYSVLEALRIAATQVLDMHVQDLQLLVIGHVDREEVDALLWDPMPGGSGLLDQICERFEEIVTVARDVVDKCPSVCDTSCIDCLQTFRNAYYHKLLERRVALDRVTAWGPRLVVTHEIPAKQPSQEPSAGTHPVNEAERRLRHLLKAAGFEEGVRGEQIRLDSAIGTTTPDVIYRATHHAPDEGICVYLDGLSGHLHGNAVTADRDRAIRTWLRNNGWDVIEIAASDLHDEGAMQRHFRRLAGYLRADDLRARVQTDTSWFGRAERAAQPGRFVPRIVRPTQAERYQNCVPLVPLKAAAGWFSEPQDTGESIDWDWTAIDSRRRLRHGMFVAQIVGKSMEPQIPDGAYCLFGSPVEGTRQGKTLLVQLHDRTDPEHGGRFTLKKYFSEKATSGDGSWRHVKVALRPNNPDFNPIELTTDDEGSVKVVAEVLELL
jgi:SOS-response transcriptional repressor LexA